MIDTANKFLIGVQGDYLLIGRPSMRYSHDDALLFAAYLVALAEPFASHPFSDVLAAVRAT